MEDVQVLQVEFSAVHYRDPDIYKIFGELPCKLLKRLFVNYGGN
jgi:hypothetical protein